MDEATLRKGLDDPMWRLSNLYWIKSKASGGDDLVMLFRPNRAQRRLLARGLHTRNIILKARQLGYSTLLAILWLDTALFSNGPIKCGVVAHEREAAETIFRDKIVFAYERLPDSLKAGMPIASKNKTEIVFAHNGASIRVATSLRSDTIHRLWISEFGKICAKYPGKAREVITGTIPTVPPDGIIAIESTAEGQDGPFYDMTQLALASKQQGKLLSAKEYRLIFSPWQDALEYEIDPTGVVITEAQHAYFNDLQIKLSREISMRKRAWYVLTLTHDFSGDQPMMWQEYPSTPEEAFAVSTEGCYYATQLAAARKAGRIRILPVEKVPVWTFWDLGRGDMTAIWLMQKVGPEYRWIRYYEESGQELDHYAEWLLKQGLVYGGHYLPHDAGVKRLGITPDTNKSLSDGLESLLPGHKVTVVPRVTNINSGIASTRKIFAASYFDEVGCADGIKRLQNYRRDWDKVRGRWKDEPLHDDNSHGADAFRQAGQVIDAGEKFDGTRYEMGKGAGRTGVGLGRNSWAGRRAGRGAMSA